MCPRQDEADVMPVMERWSVRWARMWRGGDVDISTRRVSEVAGVGVCGISG